MVWGVSQAGCGMGACLKQAEHSSGRANPVGPRGGAYVSIEVVVVTCLLRGRVAGIWRVYKYV